MSDHRIELTLYKIDRVMAGELDEFIDALIAEDQAAAAGGGRRDTSAQAICLTARRACAPPASTKPRLEARLLLAQRSA